jgi:hypothetical protein
MKKTLFIPILLLFSLNNNSFAQEKKATLLDYNWDENRSRYQLSPEEEQLPKIYLLSKSVFEYVLENKEFTMYSLDHMIIRVNSEEAIENSNKIFVSMYNTSEVVNIKARSISKDGKVIVMDKNNIKEIKNDDNNQAKKKFAIEGVEKGSEIEFFYVKKMTPSTYKYDVFQFGSPVKEAIFQLIAPNYLIFKFKRYNNFPPVKDTVIGETRIYSAHSFNVPELRSEPYANYQKNRMRMEYKLGYNQAKSNKEMNTWADIAQKKYTFIHEITPKENNAIEKLYKSLKIEDNKTLEDKIRIIENFIKTNILIKDEYKPEYFSIENIIENKYGNKHGIIKLYMALFKMANINCQLVLTSDRDDIPFDGSFESWRFINNFLFYFTETDKFLSPEFTNYRYPLIPYNLTFTDGLFLKEVKVGEFASYITSIKFISPLNYNFSGQRIDADVEFDKNMDEATLKVTNMLKGYHALTIQPYYSQIPDDKKKKALEDIMKGITQDTKYTFLEAENTDPNFTLDKPFKVHAEVRGSLLLEKAGSKVLFKVGELLDKQAELYQDKQRKMSVECDYNREYVREFKIKIPEGFRVKNLNDINMNLCYERNGDKIYGFISSFEMNGDLLSIHINEFYKEIACPVEHYEDYRKVVNAAADFNKVILVFEPK